MQKIIKNVLKIIAIAIVVPSIVLPIILALLIPFNFI